ncbi:CBN-SRP-3 protein [Caenorhabditis brenneri]|uniref:CBN-SRP-3 protein n=1 Tax=Caenorhabditis brenneri TaxID=135651 RepID=G0NEJ1_CAEBE|nr:CBN-SRP-3 protein [Caenorhabditis brenneri]
MFLEAERQFGLNFLKTLPAHNESLVFSPLSIALVLSMVHTGARGRSKEQIGDALLNGASDDQFVNHFSDVNEKIRSGTNGVEVYVANRVYLNKGFTANPSFLAVALKNYGADAKTLDFESLTAVREINTFVKEATKAKITDIASKDSIKNAVALLVNAIYFKGDWEDKFDGFSIADADFTTYSGHVKKVKFMKEFMWDRGYSSDDIFQVLHLGYADQQFQFSVFLPKERNTLTKALEKLDARRFKTLLSNVRRTFMNTQLPKFTIEREINLKTHLEFLGITDIFSDSANLSGLAKNIKISGGVHKAIIEVNEDGTVAAAATMAKAVPMSMRMETPVDFKADHPFMFTLSFMNHPIFLGVFNG